jgi:hypothetical protein
VTIGDTVVDIEGQATACSGSVADWVWEMEDMISPNRSCQELVILIPSVCWPRDPCLLQTDAERLMLGYCHLKGSEFVLREGVYVVKPYCGSSHGRKRQHDWYCWLELVGRSDHR